MDLKNIEQLKSIIPKKYLGQNFLRDESVIEKEIALADIKKTDTVLEIGPGLGALTRFIAGKAQKVIAVEKDSALADMLEKNLKDENIANVEIIRGDILKEKLPHFDKCVSNIPYQISSKITELLGRKHVPSVLIYQKEFAERIVAKNGSKNYSRISVMSQYFFNPKIEHIVGTNAFYPQPKVNSAIVTLSPRKDRPKVIDEELFFRLVRGLFAHKNQKVSKAFEHSKREFNLDKKKLRETGRSLKFANMKVRDLYIENLAEMANQIHDLLYGAE